VVDAEILRRRIDALLAYVDRLEAFGSHDRERFVADTDEHHLAERYLHLAVESALDIANGGYSPGPVCATSSCTFISTSTTA